MSEQLEDTETSLTVSSIDSKLDTIVNDIMEEDSPTKTKELVDLFNWNISKKNVARIQKLNNLYDSITDQMVERVAKKSDQFSNSDLLDYVKTIQTAIDTHSKNVAQAQEIPMIVQQTNNTINVNVTEQFDQEAKKRILAAVQTTLAQAASKPSEVIEAEVVDLQSIEHTLEDEGEG